MCCNCRHIWPKKKMVSLGWMFQIMLLQKSRITSLCTTFSFDSTHAMILRVAFTVNRSHKQHIDQYTAHHKTISWPRLRHPNPPMCHRRERHVRGMRFIPKLPNLPMVALQSWSVCQQVLLPTGGKYLHEYPYKPIAFALGIKSLKSGKWSLSVLILKLW